MNRSELDRLGERLRSEVTPADLRLLDTYRRGFRSSYDKVVDRIRSELALEVSGRPAKSTSAIVDKLRRGSMRFTQIQDIAGCRIVVANVSAQNALTTRLSEMFDVSVVDRRQKPSHGYRAVHVIARSADLPVEVQVRTELQHVWAELSEKSADVHGYDLKYGGGPKPIRDLLDAFASLISVLEDRVEADEGQDAQIEDVKRKVRTLMIEVTAALRKKP